MSDSFSCAFRNGRTRRGSLLLLVIAAHAVVIGLVLAAKTVAPLIQESPLFVDFIPMETPKRAEPRPATPKPVSKPQPPRKTETVKLETTRSEPLAEAPAAPPEKVPTTPPAAAAVPAVTPARFDAAYLKNPAPPYPPVSQRMGEEGKVVLRVLVSPQGTAESVEVKVSSGSNRLDDSALRTVRTWKFIPAKRGDVPLSSRVLVPIIFKLEQ